MPRDFMNIRAWQHADELCVQIYVTKKEFPRDERFSLTNQMRRAAASVPANIAEGSGRETKRDYLHFLHVARGSLAEVRHFIHLSRRLDYVDDATKSKLNALQDETGKTLQGLINAVSREAGV